MAITVNVLTATEIPGLQGATATPVYGCCGAVEFYFGSTSNSVQFKKNLELMADHFVEKSPRSLAMFLLTESQVSYLAPTIKECTLIQQVGGPVVNVNTKRQLFLFTYDLNTHRQLFLSRRQQKAKAATL